MGRLKKLSGNGNLIDNLNDDEYDYYLYKTSYSGNITLIPISSEWLRNIDKIRVLSTIVNEVEKKEIKTDIRIIHVLPDTYMIHYDVLYHNAQHDIGNILVQKEKP